MSSTQFKDDGFAMVAQLLSASECDTVIANLERSQSDASGTRCLLSQAWCADLATQILQPPALAALIPTGYVAVQCTYFEKSPTHNWLVPIHQDMSIPVAHRVDHPSLKGWSQKEDALYVQAPLNVLLQLVAVRVHLDDCTADDGPLRVVPGSHVHGILKPEESIALRDAGTEVVCTAARGAALVMRPLLLHASSKSKGSSQRRVLHYLFGPSQLPLGLQWRQESAASAAP
jgi:ectoine hydroxylase-related dioxygenase (phytanoyl-CoA dioxygenase family)